MSLVSEILGDAAQKVTRFNDMGLHYNLVADQIYERRFAWDTDPIDKSFLPYIIAGLLSFNMGRMMGDKPYEFEGNSYASRLNRKLQNVGSALKPLLNIGLTEADLQSYHGVILEAYTILSAKGNGALHVDKTKSFHVGSTKVLHFLNPKLFIIVDSNASRAFQVAHNVPFRKTAQPGYSAERYIECMEYARNDILSYGLEQFQALEPSVPIARIYDKLTFVTGYELSQK